MPLLGERIGPVDIIVAAGDPLPIVGERASNRARV
jgi:hypothetical protein